jgi:isopenicillin N synthase-like dioxygenase
MAGDWKSKSEITSARVQKAIAYGDKMAEIVNGGGESWDALLPMIDSSRFRRRGNERTEMDWPAYRAMLEQWQGHAGKYEKTLHRASEVGNVVYLDLDEAATAKDGSVQTLRSMSIYEFDDSDRIVGVDVIMGFHQPQG